MSNDIHQLLQILHRASIKAHILAEEILPVDRFEARIQRQHQQTASQRTSLHLARQKQTARLLNLFLNPEKPIDLTLAAPAPQKTDIPIALPIDIPAQEILFSEQPAPAPPPPHSIPKLKSKSTQRRRSRKRLTRSMARAIEQESTVKPALAAEPQAELPITEIEPIELLDFSDFSPQESDFDLPNLRPFAAEGSSADNIAERLQELNDALDQSPNDGQLLLQRAQLFEEESNWICAISDYLKGAEQLSDPAPWAALEKIYREQNLSSKAANAATQLQMCLRAQLKNRT